jgi:LemA protein
MQLQEELSGTESKIAFARQFYNDNVMAYNTQIQTLPSSLIAGPCGFTQKEYFGIQDDSERQVPKVAF